MEDPFEKLENGNVRLKEGTVFNPAFLTSSDKKVFLPILLMKNLWFKVTVGCIIET